MKDILKLLIGFLPWIAFAALAGPPLIRLEISIVVSFLLTLTTGFPQLKKGFILTWGSLIFFGGNLILVVLLKNIWVMTHMGILAPVTLASITWLSLALGKPFVLQYARENTPKERWEEPEFIAGCRHLTIFWGCLFISTTLIAVAKFMKLGGPEWIYGVLSLGFTVVGFIYTEWFKAKKRRLREQGNSSPSS